jgi:chemotaxis protein methyltransferase CheR
VRLNLSITNNKFFAHGLETSYIPLYTESAFSAKITITDPITAETKPFDPMPKPHQSALVREASALVEARTGLSGQSQKRINMEAVLDELSGGDLAEFVRTLRVTPDSAPGWQRLMRALVIGETYFFRHRPHFDLLHTHILPQISPQRTDLNMWSAGCASGEETYSIAMSLYENQYTSPHREVHLIGTDINAHALNTARQGVYRTWAFRGTENHNFQNHYFDRIEGGFQIKSYIRSMATFRQGNVLNGSPFLQCDVIFCCNVLLYFEAEAVNRAEDVLFHALMPGGWLVLGPAEALRTQRDRWITHIFPGTVIYQKPLDATPDFKSVPITRSYRDTPAPAPHAQNSASRPQPALAYADAVRLFHDKAYGEAEKILMDVLERDPKHAAAHTLFACLYANRGALAEAHQHLDTALRLDSLYADAYYLRGILLLDTGREEAAESFRAALYCQRGHALSAMILGTLYLRGEDKTRARRTWETALESLEGVPAEARISDLSDMTAGAVIAFLKNQLETV